VLTRRRARRQRGGEFSALGAMVSGKNEVGQEIFPPHPSPRPLGRRSGPSPRSPYPPPRQPSSCHADEPDTRRSYRRKRQSCGSIPGRRWCCCRASPRPSPRSGPCRGDLEMSWSTRRQVPHSPTPLMIHPPPFHRHLLLMHHGKSSRLDAVSPFLLLRVYNSDSSVEVGRDHGVGAARQA